MSWQHLVSDLQMQALNTTHRIVRALSGGRLLGDKVLGMDVIELHVVGRTSGQRRSTLLTSPLRDERRVVLVASKGGDDRDPEWYRNLVANPAVELTIVGLDEPLRGAHGDRGREGRAVAADHLRLRWLRRLPTAHEPRHPGRHLRAGRRRHSGGSATGRPNVTAARTAAGARSTSWWSGREPSASLTVEKAMRIAT